MNKALFLDRDGVINDEINYLYKISDIKFISGVFETCREVQKYGYKIIIITNQSGIARGLYSEDDFQILSDWMIKQFKSQGVTIDKIYYCPYHTSGLIDKYKRHSWDRKPNPGMLFQARDELGINLSQSLIIGDMLSDIYAGINAKIGKTVLVKTGNKISSKEENIADHVINSIGETNNIMNIIKSIK